MVSAGVKMQAGREENQFIRTWLLSVPKGYFVPKTSSTITLELVEKTNPSEGNLSVPKPHDSEKGFRL